MRGKSRPVAPVVPNLAQRYPTHLRAFALGLSKGRRVLAWPNWRQAGGVVRPRRQSDLQRLQFEAGAQPGQLGHHRHGPPPNQAFPLQGKQAHPFERRFDQHIGRLWWIAGP